MALPCGLTDGVADTVEVVAMTGRKIVEADHVLAQAEQRFRHMVSDEPGAPRNQPAHRLLAQRRAGCRISDGRVIARRHQSLHTSIPCACRAAMSAWLFTST